MDNPGKPGGKVISVLLPILLALIFALLGIVSLASINSLHGNARVINYTGILRGATQRLVKQELYRQPDEELSAQLDGLLRELRTGQGENNLILIKDQEFQSLLAMMATEWEEIKAEIVKLREIGRAHV